MGRADSLRNENEKHRRAGSFKMMTALFFFRGQGAKLRRAKKQTSRHGWLESGFSSFKRNLLKEALKKLVALGWLCSDDRRCFFPRG